ncbi:MAG: FUN14 domain-containing protein [Candidatus Bathyarchaeia archaeon]
MSQILTPFIYQMGTGVAGGFLVGYAIKKVLKILMVVLGFCFVAVSYLGFSEIINVNYDKLASAISGLVTQASGFLSTTIEGLPFASTFLAGLTIGIMKG